MNVRRVPRAGPCRPAGRTRCVRLTLDRYAARSANCVLVAVDCIAVLAARSAASDTGNQPRVLSPPSRAQRASTRLAVAFGGGGGYEGQRPWLGGAALAAAILALTSTAVVAQWHGYPTPGIPRNADGTPNLEAPAPKTADGTLDLSGIWLSSRARFNLAQSLKPGDSVPFTPEGKAVFDDRRANLSKDDPSARCLPTGLPLRPTLATPFKIVQTPSVMAILYESRTQFRQILTDGRPLPKEYDWRAWQGFSVGRWEGDTFVVETAGFNGKAWLDQAGYPGTEAMRMTERYRRRDVGHMEVETIIEDPTMYTRPWSIYADLVLQTDTELLEFICEENEKDSDKLVGK